MIRSISFIDITAYRTLSTGIARVYQDYLNTSQGCLVFDFLYKVVKCPAMVYPTLAFSNCYPVADTAQILKGNPPTGVFCLADNMFADYVVGIIGKVSLLFATFFEQASGRIGLLALQLASEIGVPGSDIIQMATGIYLTIRISSNIFDTQVYAKKFRDFFDWRFINITSGKQVELAANKTQITFTTPVFEKLKLALTGDKRDFQPAPDSPNAHNLFVELPRENTVIVRDCPFQAESSLGIFIQFIGISNFGNLAHGHLSRQSEVSTNIFIDQPVNVKLLKGLGFPSSFTDLVAGLVGSLKRLAKSVPLLVIGNKFNFGNQFHNMSIVAQTF